MATPEKAILDSLDDELLAGSMGEIVKAVWRGLSGKSLDRARLLEYAGRYLNAAVIARLGYILDRFGVAEARGLRSLVRRRGAIPLLATKGSHAEGEAPIDRDWHLRINLPAALFDNEVIA